MILVNGEKINIEKFPNNESKINFISDWYRYQNIKLKWESDEDFINLMFIKNYMDEDPGYIIILEILYMPYSRMDRKIKNTLFTLKNICDFINNLNFTKVYIHEPHSDVTTSLINRCKVIDSTLKLFNDFKHKVNIDYIFYPDAGAQKRYYINGYKELVGFKERDLDTGKIKKYNIFGDFEEGSSIVILDDLCSYGGTFDLASKQLKEKGAGDIYLIVAHCEENILKGNIFKNKNIKKVLTTNSIIDRKYRTDKLIIEDLLN